MPAKPPRLPARHLSSLRPQARLDPGRIAREKEAHAKSKLRQEAEATERAQLTAIAEQKALEEAEARVAAKAPALEEAEAEVAEILGEEVSEEEVSEEEVLEGLGEEPPAEEVDACPVEDCVLHAGHVDKEHGDDHQAVDGTWFNFAQVAAGEGGVVAETKEPEAKEPEAKEPEAKEPEAKEPEVVEEAPLAPPPAEVVVAPEVLAGKTKADISALLSGPNAEISAALETGDWDGVLADVLAAETAGKNRKGAKDSIQARIAAKG